MYTDTYIINTQIYSYNYGVENENISAKLAVAAAPTGRGHCTQLKPPPPPLAPRVVDGRSPSGHTERAASYRSRGHIDSRSFRFPRPR